MLFKSFLVAATSAVSIASGPASLIENNMGFPVYQTALEEDMFTLSVRIVVRTAPVGETPGVADFEIAVTLPNGEKVTGDCPGAEYFFDNGAMGFDPYNEDTSCTGEFRVAMNTAVGSDEDNKLVTAPIELAWNSESNYLTANIGKEIDIRFAGYTQ